MIQNMGKSQLPEGPGHKVGNMAKLVDRSTTESMSTTSIMSAKTHSKRVQLDLGKVSDKHGSKPSTMGIKALRMSHMKACV